jgi:hypothetical protein
MKSRTEEEVTVAQGAVMELQEPSTTYRFSVDIDMVPAGMRPEQACSQFVAALEAAFPVVRSVRINQCSSLTPEGMQRRAV